MSRIVHLAIGDGWSTYACSDCGRVVTGHVDKPCPVCVSEPRRAALDAQDAAQKATDGARSVADRSWCEANGYDPDTGDALAGEE